MATKISVELTNHLGVDPDCVVGESQGFVRIVVGTTTFSLRPSSAIEFSQQIITAAWNQR